MKTKLRKILETYDDISEYDTITEVIKDIERLYASQSKSSDWCTEDKHVSGCSCGSKSSDVSEGDNE